MLFTLECSSCFFFSFVKVYSLMCCFVILFHFCLFVCCIYVTIWLGPLIQARGGEVRVWHKMTRRGSGIWWHMRWWWFFELLSLDIPLDSAAQCYKWAPSSLIFTTLLNCVAVVYWMTKCYLVHFLLLIVWHSSLLYKPLHNSKDELKSGKIKKYLLPSTKFTMFACWKCVLPKFLCQMYFNPKFDA